MTTDSPFSDSRVIFTPPKTLLFGRAAHTRVPALLVLFCLPGWGHQVPPSVDIMLSARVQACSQS